MTLCSSCKQPSVTLFGCRCDGLMHCGKCLETHFCPADIKPLWAHQVRAGDLTQRAELEGHKAICVTSPTGSGKRRMIIEDCRRAREAGKRSIVLTNRKLLTKQSTRDFAAHGVSHGVMAAGYSQDWPNWVQVASIQTLSSRVSRRQVWELPQADYVMIDEGHNRAFDSFLEQYLERGAVVHCYTATPTNLHKAYTSLVVAAKNSELRLCGALVPCDVFAPSEPDMKGVRIDKLGEFVQAGAAERVMQCTVFADVFAWWKRINTFGGPTLLWAPGVPESRWFVREFERLGVRAAHLDAETPEDERARIEAGSQDGDIQIVSSYGILREGADWPWIRCGILVQVCGKLSTFLQIAGRLLRAYPGKERATLLDFSGCWWRHGSPNADRAWKLGDTDKKIAADVKKAREQGKEAEPIRCPRCGGIRKAGPKCSYCGYEHTRSVRMVRMLDGSLKKMTGNVVKHKKTESDDQKTWKGCLYACAKVGRSLRMAAGWFNQKTGHHPGPDLKPQPESRDSVDWDRPCGEVYPWLLKRRKSMA